MIKFYEKQCIVFPIKKNDIGCFFEILPSLDNKYNLIINNLVKGLNAPKGRINIRREQVKTWLESDAKNNFLFEVFIPKRRRGEFFALALAKKGSLPKRYYRYFQKSCKIGLVAYAFADEQSNSKKFIDFYSELKVAIKKSFKLKKFPFGGPFGFLNTNFDKLSNKTKSIQELTKINYDITDLFTDKNFRDVILEIKKNRKISFSGIHKNNCSKLLLVHILQKARRCGIIKQQYNLKRGGLKEINYSITKKGCSLLNGNNWLFLYAYSVLKSMGIPPEKIRIGVKDGPHELDLIVNVDGYFVLMELKGAKFSVGHAYSFIAKYFKYHPHCGVIISTEGFDKNAREHLEGVDKNIYCIENINNLKDAFYKSFSIIYERKFLSLISNIETDRIIFMTLINKMGIIIEPLGKAFKHNNAIYGWPFHVRDQWGI